jgi:hypothetical protein
VRRARRRPVHLTLGDPPSMTRTSQPTVVEASRKDEERNTAWDEEHPRFRHGATAGWEAALLEFEHQADHWDTPDHRETGHLIASALRAAVDIARSGGLRCEHREDGDHRQNSQDAGGAEPGERGSRHRRNRHAA